MDVLGVAEVQPQDDFFDLGGHSLIAVELIEHIKNQTGVGLTLNDLHRAPTVATLVDEILRRVGEA
jgi:acyl carrier protein